MSCTTPVLLCTTKYYPVLQILLCTTPVLPSTTKYYSSTTPILPCTTKYYQYYSVLQSTTPILLCTTKYYSNTTPYYKYYSVLLQYYPVLQSTTQVLFCTTPVLQSTTPVLPRTTKYFMIDPHHIWNVICNARSNKRQPATSANTACHEKNESHDWSASQRKRHLQCAEQQASPSNFTKYCACHAKWISWLIHITKETSFTMRGATVNTLQPHQILRLPRKMNLRIDPHHIWNVIYNARSNRHHPPTSPNTAPCHAKWISWLIHIAYDTSFTMRGATGITLQPHQILRPATQNEHATSDRNLLKTAEVAFPMRDRSEHDPSTIRERSDPENANRNPPRHRGYFSHSPGADSIENYNVSRSGYHSKFHHMLRLPRKVTHELLQMLRLPRKVTHELHQMLHLPKKVTHELHHRLRLPRKVTHELQQMLHLPQKVTHELHQMLHLPEKVKHERHQMLHLPQKVTHELHQMLHLPQKVKH